MKDYQVMYIPRIQDELPVAEFDTLDSAVAHMEHIKKVKPKVYDRMYKNLQQLSSRQRLY